MKKLITLVAVTLAVALSGAAMAHSEKPKHGGIVSTASDLSFELVNQEGRTTLYITDHGKPLDTNGVTGKLTVLNGSEKTEVPLEPDGANKLLAKEDAKLAKGSKVVASLVFPGKKNVNVRFSVK